MSIGRNIGGMIGGKKKSKDKQQPVASYGSTPLPAAGTPGPSPSTGY